MAGDDGLRGGKPDPVASGGTGAGGIRPVESVKVPGKLRRVYPSAGIGYNNINIFSSLRYAEPNDTLRVTVFDRVVQKNGEQTENFSLS